MTCVIPVVMGMDLSCQHILNLIPIDDFGKGDTSRWNHLFVLFTNGLVMWHGLPDFTHIQVNNGADR